MNWRSYRSSYTYIIRWNLQLRSFELAYVARTCFKYRSLDLLSLALYYLLAGRFQKEARSVTTTVKQCRPRTVAVRCGSRLFKEL